jgi:integrase
MHIGASASGAALSSRRHTCATLMHLSGVPVVVIAAWIGHADATLSCVTDV